MNNNEINDRAEFWLQLAARIKGVELDTPQNCSICCRAAIEILKAVKGEVFACNGNPKEVTPVIERLQTLEQEQLVLGTA